MTPIEEIFKHQDTLPKELYGSIMFFDYMNKVFNFEGNSNSGVYIIEDFYIGKSKDIKKRLKQHLNDCLTDNNKKANINKINQMVEILHTRKLNIKLISTNINDEIDLIVKHFFWGYPLVNKPNTFKKSYNVFVEELIKRDFNKFKLELNSYGEFNHFKLTPKMYQLKIQIKNDLKEFEDLDVDIDEIDIIECGVFSGEDDIIQVDYELKGKFRVALINNKEIDEYYS